MSLSGAIGAELAPVLGGELAVFDVHAHTGVDVDGSERSCEQHVEALAALGPAARSAIFPLCVEGGYGPDNRRVIEEAGRHPDRLVAFARLDPRLDGAVEAGAALADGAVGFKLHPRAEDFRLDHPNVAAIAAVAAEARRPLLIHAGLGVGSFGGTITELADRAPGCPIVLAHAAVSDLSWLGPVAAEHPNLFFDTSWWNASDLLALLALVPPGQILFGSDEPYMGLELVLAIALRCARFVGLDDDALRLVFGAQAERLVRGEPALSAGPAPGPRERPVELTDARLITPLAAAGGALLGGGEPAPMFEMVGLALGDGGAAGSAERAVVASLVEEAKSGSPRAHWAVAVALALLATPGVGAPAALV